MKNNYNKEIKVMTRCINCKSAKIDRNIISYSKINYSVCNNCGAHYQNPIIRYDYNENYWECSVDIEGNKRNLINEREDKIKNWYGEAIKEVNKYDNIKVLDIGCGLGFFLSALKKNIKKIGVEESEFACNYIRENFKEIKVHQGRIENLKEDDNQFDVVMLYHVIEHLEEPHNVLKKISKLIKKDGIFILGTPNVESIGAKIFGKNFRHYTEAHPCLYSIKNLSNLLNQYGFEINKIEKPFWKTKYANLINIFKLLFINKISPAFYGSIVTIYSRKRIL
tara:strand:+ start:952 stop:1791 length:840 start_codon:yes stop_codon:yes gene_type:complete